MVGPLQVSFHQILLRPNRGNEVHWQSYGEESEARITIEKKRIYMGLGPSVNYSFKPNEITHVNTSTSTGVGQRPHHSVTFVASKNGGTTVECVGLLSSDKVFRTLVNRLTKYQSDNAAAEDPEPDTIDAPRGHNNGNKNRQKKRTSSSRNGFSGGLGGEGRGKRKYPHSSRGTFATTKLKKRAFGPRQEMPWDDEEEYKTLDPIDSTSNDSPTSKAKEACEDDDSSPAHEPPQSPSSSPAVPPSSSSRVVDVTNNEETDDDDDDGVIIATSRRTPFGTVMKRKVAKRRVLDDDESDDDDQIPMTTPRTSTQRMVSPSLTVPKKDSTKATVFDSPKQEQPEALGDDGDTQFVEERSPMISDEKRHKTQPDISNFFAPKAAKAPTLSRMKVKVQSPVMGTPPRAKVASTNKKSSNMFARAKHNDEWLDDTLAATASPKRVQARRLLGKASPFVGHTPKTAEEEDPIVDDDSTDDSVTFPRSANGQRHTVFDVMDRLPPRRAMSAKARRNQHSKFRLNLSRNGNSPSSKMLFKDEGQDDNESSKELVRRHRGLRNLGNTCYINASIQMIANWCVGRLSTVDDPKFEEQQPILHSFVVIARQLLAETPLKALGPPPAIDPTVVKKAIDARTDKFLGYEQRDAHEFLSAALDFMHEELEKRHEENLSTASPSIEPLPTDDFRMTVEVSLTCNSCNYTRSKEEMYRCLAIDLPQNQGPDAVAHIPTSLDQFFEPEELELRCEKCAEGTHASQTMKILSRPRMLLLQLKRFVYIQRPNSPAAGEEENSQWDGLRKNKVPVDIMHKLSLEKYCQGCSGEEALATTDNEYSLQSIVHHLGTRSVSGHYTAQALRAPLDNQPTDDLSNKGEHGADQLQWTTFDDQNSGRATLEGIRKDKLKQKQAYMLLYQLKEV